MANRLTMAKIQAILSLHQQNWPNRRIARELDVDRETVAKYVRAASCASKPAKAPIGSAETAERAAEPRDGPPAVGASGDKGTIETSPSSPCQTYHRRIQNQPEAPIGSGPKSANGSASKPADHRVRGGTPIIGLAAAGGAADPAPSPPEILVDFEATALGRDGSRSVCEPYRQVILEKLEQGLSAQRIYQDLLGDGFDHEYHSVRRFVAKLRGTRPLPFRRMECAAGEEAQVDFGTGAWIELPNGKRRRSHVFRIVLSFSRKAYSEAVYRQTAEDFIRCIENAFWHFGGVPKVLVIDNLKAAVKQPDWYDPELNPKIQSFCEHYGVVILPTKPRTPRHKGKIESGVGYVQDNGLKGHRFTSLEAENEHLAQWEATFDFLEEHPIIRSLSDYGKLVATSFAHPWKRDQRPQRPTADAVGARLPNPHPLPSSLCSVPSTQNRSIPYE